MESSPWPKLPVELTYEIASHNAQDRPTLFAMALVSKFMRALALEHIFASVRLNSTEDFTWWAEMLHRTPTLRETVKSVKFSVFGKHPRWQIATAPRALVPPIFGPMPGVRTVEWHGRAPLNIAMARGCMELFPNVAELRLAHMNFDSWGALSSLLGACGGGLKALILIEVRTWEGGAWFSPDSFDLSGLDTLRISAPDYIQNYITHLMETPLPRALKSLAFTSPRRWHDSPTQFFSPRPLEKLLHLNIATLVDLVLDSSFLDNNYVPDPVANEQFITLLCNLPAFPALESLTLSLDEDHQAELALRAITVPHLTTLTFRIALYRGDPESDQWKLDDILKAALPWGTASTHHEFTDITSESMYAFLVRSFPYFRRLRFHFCTYIDSEMHFRPSLRRNMEDTVRRRLDETGAGVPAECIEMEWLDPDDRPIVYEADGRPLDCEGRGKPLDGDDESHESCDPWVKWRE
ncbi:hypothetical protein C8R46DRAFT_325713 [Mycena filopes]|nr:hypothetical protein C8R46DRAFT_325713 [Mycena filopes]